LKFKTLRNLLASMLVLGVAASVIMAGNGTLALFNATTQNPNNNFVTDDLEIQDNGGTTTCTSSASGTNGANPNGTCDTIGSITNMIPGDAKVGKVKITNASQVANFTLSLTVTDANSNQALDKTTAPSSGGLGLFIFACRDATPKPVDCTTGSPTQVLSVYASNGTSTCTAGTLLPLASSHFQASDITVSSTDESITFNGKNCKPGNDSSPLLTAVNALGINGPDGSFVGGDGVTYNNVFLSSIANSGKGVDYYAVVVNMGGNAGNSLAGGSSNNNNASLTFAWKATQIVGKAQ
jgi:hypothetical protein